MILALASAKKFIREDVESNCSELYARLQLEVSELEKTIQSNDHERSFPHGVNHPFSKSIERLNSAKMVLLASTYIFLKFAYVLTYIVLFYCE